MIHYVHDALIDFGGAEVFLEKLVECHPGDVYTLVYDKERFSHTKIGNMRVYTCWINEFPLLKREYRYLLPLLPRLIERIKVPSEGAIISSSYAVAKGIIPSPGQKHICYCHTPMRNGWDQREVFLKRFPKSMQKGVEFLLNRFCRWDREVVNRVDHFIANSRCVAKRIKDFYGRDATVVYPPVDIDGFSISTEKEEYYLTVSRIVPVKRIDCIIEAFRCMPKKRLKIVGEGVLREELEKNAPLNVEFLGFQRKKDLHELYRKAKGFVFMAEEDFGLSPVEAMASGTAVIAYGKGGCAETVSPEGGILFNQQTKESLIEAIEMFEKKWFDPEEVRKSVLRFSTERFHREFRQVLNQYGIFWP